MCVDQTVVVRVSVWEPRKWIVRDGGEEDWRWRKRRRAAGEVLRR